MLVVDFVQSTDSSSRCVVVGAVSSRLGMTDWMFLFALLSSVESDRRSYALN